MQDLAALPTAKTVAPKIIGATTGTFGLFSVVAAFAFGTNMSEKTFFALLILAGLSVLVLLVAWIFFKIAPAIIIEPSPSLQGDEDNREINFPINKQILTDTTPLKNNLIVTILSLGGSIILVVGYVLLLLSPHHILAILLICAGITPLGRSFHHRDAETHDLIT